MLDGLTLGDLGQVSAGTVLVVVVWMLLTGRIASRREVDAERQRADTWQRAWTAERAARDVERDQKLDTLVEYAKTADRVLTALDQTRRGESP